MVLQLFMFSRRAYEFGFKHSGFHSTRKSANCAKKIFLIFFHSYLNVLEVYGYLFCIPADLYGIFYRRIKIHAPFSLCVFCCVVRLEVSLIKINLFLCSASLYLSRHLIEALGKTESWNKLKTNIYSSLCVHDIL